jgi:hypothetical protein
MDGGNGTKSKRRQIWMFGEQLFQVLHHQQEKMNKEDDWIKKRKLYF